MGIVIKQIKKIPEYKVKEVVETYQENLVLELFARILLLMIHQLLTDGYSIIRLVGMQIIL